MYTNSYKWEFKLSSLWRQRLFWSYMYSHSETGYLHALKRAVNYDLVLLARKHMHFWQILSLCWQLADLRAFRRCGGHIHVRTLFFTMLTMLSIVSGMKLGVFCHCIEDSIEDSISQLGILCNFYFFCFRPTVVVEGEPWQ